MALIAGATACNEINIPRVMIASCLVFMSFPYLYFVLAKFLLCRLPVLVGSQYLPECSIYSGLPTMRFASCTGEEPCDDTFVVDR